MKINSWVTMNKYLLLIIAALVLLVGCGSAGDPLYQSYFEGLVVEGDAVVEGDLEVSGNTTLNTLTVEGDISLSGNTTIERDLTVSGNTTLNTLTLNGETTFNEQISLDGDGEIWQEFRLPLNWSIIQALGKPTRVTRGDFSAFSLPIYGADNEELFFEICIPERWKGQAWTKLADVGDGPGSMESYGGSLYIPMEGDDNVWEYRNGILSISGAVGSEPVYTQAYDGNLYVSCANDDTIWVKDGSVWVLSGNVGNGPEGMQVHDGFLYVACNAGDEIWRYSSATGWTVDPALGLGGVAGAVGTSPRFLEEFDGDLYVSCSGVDDDVWIRTGGVWAKDADVDGAPAVFQAHDGELYLNCEDDDTIWKKNGVWAVCTNILFDQGNAPVGLEEYEDSLFSACMDSIWSDIHTVDTYAVPFWNQNSRFVVAGDVPKYLEIYDGKLYCACTASDTIWVYEGETVKLAIHTWITSAQANATDAFRIQVVHSAFTPNEDIVLTASQDTTREIKTGIAAQYRSYGLHVPLDFTNYDSDDSLAIRLIRIASSDEIAGEVAIQHVGAIFKCDKLGAEEP